MAIDINFGALQTANPFQSYTEGVDAGQKMRLMQAQRAAGNLFATDPDAAANTLAAGGDLQGSIALRQAGRQDKSFKAQQNAAAKYAAGDYQGAMADLAPTGDIGTQTQLQNANLTQQKAKLAYTADEATKLYTIYQQAGGDANPQAKDVLKQAFAAAAPSYKAVGGATDETLAQLGAALDQNPTATLRALANPPEIEHTTVGDTLYTTEKGTGRVLSKQTGVKYQVVKDAYGNEKVIALGEDGAGPAQPAAGSAQPANADASQPRGVRNNNPLNVTTLGGGQSWAGQTGADGHYAVFDSPEAGFAAADKNLTAYATHHGVNTIAGVISRWAPASENDTHAYIGTVANDLGVDPNQPIDLTNPQIRHAVLTSMSKVELGRAAPQTDAQPYQVAANGPTPPPPAGAGGARVVYDSTPANQQGANANLAGDAFLQTVPPQIRATVKGIAEGRLPVSPMMMRTPQGQAVLNAVAQYDPTFNAQDYNARNRALQDRTSGKLAQSVTSMNTALGHMSTLLSAIDTMNTTGLPLNNRAARFIAEGTGTDQRFADFDAAKKAVADEMTRVFRGTGGSEGDIQSYLAQLDYAKNPETLKETVKQLADLLQSRLEAAGDQYGKAMNLTDLTTLLSPKARATLQRIEGMGRSSPGGAPAQPGGPKIIRYDAQGNRLQ